MFNQLKEDQIVNRVGGRFRLTTLLQKRMVALNQGALPLVEAEEGESHMAIALREIAEGKIFLDERDQWQIARDEAAADQDTDGGSDD